MVVSVKSPTIGPAELATIANRVVNCLSRQGQVKPSEREDIFRKAIKFIDMAASGDEIMKTGQLRANASGDLRSYGWITRGFVFLSNKSGKPGTEDFREELRKLRKTLSNLEAGEPVPKDRSDEIKELFAFLRRMALAIDALPTDKISISPFAIRT